MVAQQYKDHLGQKANQCMSPKHVAIIMDGNGRWATQRNLSRTKGHKQGVESAWRAVNYCLKNKISVLTLFAFGQENWKRPSQEVRNLFRIFHLLLRRDLERLHKHNIKLRVIGDRTPFSDALKKMIYDAETMSHNNTGLILNIAINYSGKWDILQSVQQLMMDKPESLSEIESHFERGLSLYGLPEPDLFIRTSGMQRLSNFLLWDLAYTEIYFTSTLWPDFTETEFDKALSFFSATERKFGLISEQVEKQCSSIES